MSGDSRTASSAMDPALDPPPVRRTGTERELLQAWLDYHRQTLRWKCSNLTPEQLCRASVPPSNLTLAGLVRHMSEVERWWWRAVVAAEDVDTIYCASDDDGDFTEVAPATVAADLAIFEQEIAAADAVFAAADLDAVVRHPRRQVDYSVRWVAQHMIEEWARHNGHADLVRERIDGATGS
ncbi:MAG: DinB family protein [Candidatus Phosphoribacter sp.]|nr:DinB family protein [Actinomycetales bacterium]